MSFPRTVTQRVACKACSAPVSRSFTPSSAHNVANSVRPAWRPSHIRRAFTSTALQHAEKPDKPISADLYRQLAAEDAAEETYEDVIEEEETSAEPTTATAEDAQASIPWYLRSQPTPPPKDPERATRELIPTLPDHPPPLLKTFLDYVSITAGLDDLILYDLRHLDPPPALGANLIMVIGTARSEKHLHVSADRFCRWLRREHGLKANAAGLLGRNELKIKLRRKAKRMKMLANVGGQELDQTNIDDGIRTGWICCTIGRIEAHPEDPFVHKPVDDEDFVGFRDVNPGVNVVVQMFTEEKRAEIDLETLWGGVLKTHERNDAIAEAQLEELDEMLDAGQAQAERQQRIEDALDAVIKRPPPSSAAQAFRFKKPAPTVGDAFPETSGDTASGQQIRRLHTVGLGTSL